MNWVMQDIELVEAGKIKASIPLPKPENFEQMVQIAKILSQDFEHVRFDLYKLDDNDILMDIIRNIKGDVKNIRSNKESHTDDFVNKLGRLPKWVMAIIVWIIKRLDNHDMLPQSLTKNSIYHSTVLLSNLGSIHCDGIYHNLTNFGTNSILLTIGEIKEEVKVIDGEIVKRYVCDFGITLDERIADGVYFAKSINLLEYILNDPKLLEGKVNDKIVISRDK